MFSLVLVVLRTKPELLLLALALELHAAVCPELSLEAQLSPW